jgi:hypothetical protein
VFEQPEYKCPHCGFAIGEELRGKDVFTCATCGRGYRVAEEDVTGRVVLFEDSDLPIVHPLWLPKGSVRALVGLSLASCFWMVAIAGKDVPPQLFSLVLAVTAYYFAFRVRLKAAGSRYFDPAARTVDPLHLPGGFVRGLLATGFVVSAVAVHVQGRLGQPEFLEFFVLLGGLVAGSCFRRWLESAQGTLPHNALGHFKALGVLLVASALFYLYITGAHANLPHWVLLLLSCLVAFYFGSRT